MAGLDADRQQRALARLRAELDLVHVGDNALAFLRGVRTTDALVRELLSAWARADAPSRAAIARTLARCHAKPGADAIASLLAGPDALQAAEAPCGPDDLKSVRLRLVLTNRLASALSDQDADPQAPPDPAVGMALACSGLAGCAPDASALERLAAHQQDITPAQFARLIGRAGAPPLCRDPIGIEIAWSLMSNLGPAGHQALRAACDDYLIRAVTVHCGEIRFLAGAGHPGSQQSPSSLLTINRSDWERTHPTGDEDRVERDLIDESAILSGSLDAEQRIRSFIVLQPGPSDPPASATSPSDPLELFSGHGF